MKYDLSAIMSRAWAIFRTVLIWASHGDGKTYTASFFGASQVQPIKA